MDLQVSAVVPPCQISSVAMSQYLGKPLVILCYPYDFLWDQGDELRAFADNYDRLKAELDVEFVSCSTDSAYSHFAWMTLVKEVEVYQAIGTKIPFTMIADKTQELVKAFEVLDGDSGLAKHCILILDELGQELKRLECMPMVSSEDECPEDCTFKFEDVFAFIKEVMDVKKAANNSDEEWTV